MGLFWLFFVINIGGFGIVCVFLVIISRIGGLFGVVIVWVVSRGSRLGVCV